MIASTARPARLALDDLEVRTDAETYWNLPPAELVEQAILRSEGRLAATGAFVVATGVHTGRAPRARFIVRDSETEDKVRWGAVNRPLAKEQFNRLRDLVVANLSTGDVFVRDAWCGAALKYRMGVRVITATAWHNHFAYNMFLRPTDDELNVFNPQWTVLHAPQASAADVVPEVDGPTFIVLNFTAREVVIGGSAYAGEIKKAMFSVMNFGLPEQGVLPMHCSANIGSDRRVALFFGLSGTGKTTLSADSDRNLIGDDEHGWSLDGVFNFEGGCYAKTIHMTEASEPEIYQAASRFGTILENVPLDEQRQANFGDSSLTENTRASYPIEYLSNIAATGTAGHPSHVVFLTADAFGVLPPVARLSRDQAMYHFMSGYTAKVAGTEHGISEPTATFSACFGEPFLPLHPRVYAEMLGRLMDEHNVQVWLVNTGWSGGAYGEGQRIRLTWTRAMVRAVLDGSLNDVPTKEHAIFGLMMPMHVAGVPDAVLDPRNTWSDGVRYDQKASELAQMFRRNFERYADGVDERVLAAAPR